MNKNMSVNLKRILSVLVFLIILFFALRKCTMLLEQKSSRIKYTDFIEGDTEYDCYLMGTSIMLNSVLPMELWKDYGISSYNFGSSNCTPAEDYYILKEAVRYKKPKLVVIDLMGVKEFNDIGNGKYMWTAVEAQHTQFDIFPFTDTKVEAVEDLFDIYEDRNDFLWSFIMFHNRWNELEEQDFNYRNMLNVEKGALTNLGSFGKASESVIMDDIEVDLAGVNYDYFIKIVEFCEKQHIEVLGLYLPHPVEELNVRVANSLEKVAQKYDNLEYVNMLNMDIHDLYTDYTIDNLHPNMSGALKSTAYVGKYINENYDLADHREDPSWLLAEKKYLDFKRENLIKQEELEDYLVQLSDDDFTAKAVVYDERIINDKWLMRLFDNADIKPVFNEEKGSADIELEIRDETSGTVLENVSFVYEGRRLVNDELFLGYKEVKKEQEEQEKAH
ncbi:MAG: hypothetical protein K6E98_02315 [Lachnospiraceae bacterium]|nr:hypothetical protein [Lachnospiraceae bacterium]